MFLSRLRKPRSGETTLAARGRKVRNLGNLALSPFNQGSVFGQFDFCHGLLATGDSPWKAESVGNQSRRDGTISSGLCHPDGARRQMPRISTGSRPWLGLFRRSAACEVCLETSFPPQKLRRDVIWI